MSGACVRAASRTSGARMRRVFVWAALALCVCPASCKREPAPAPTPVASADRTPPAAPAGHLGDLTILHPNQTWRELRPLAGRAGELLPLNYPLLVTSLLGLSPLTADSIEGESPALGCLVKREGREPSLVLGLRVTHAGELKAKLTTGDAPPFRAEPADARGLSLLAPSSKGTRDVALGLIDEYLLISRDLEALQAAGPYVARTLAKKPLPSEPITLVVPKAALSGPLLASLRNAWQARRAALEAAERTAREARGRPADFGDPAAILLAADAAMETAFSILESADGARISLAPSADRATVRLEITPTPGGAAAAMHAGMSVGDVAPLGELPASTAGALLLRGEPGDPDAGQGADGFLRMLGTRVGAAESRRIQAATSDWELARGGTSLYAAFAAPAPSLGFWFELRDEARFRKSAKSVLELLALPSIAGPIEVLAGKPAVAFSSVEVEGAPSKAERAVITLKRTAKPAVAFLVPERFEIAWLTAGEHAHGAIGADAGRALTELLAARKGAGPRLGSDAWFDAARKKAAAGVAVALWLDVSALSPAFGGAGRAPLLGLVGKDAQGVWISVDASPAALQIVAQASMRR